MLNINVNRETGSVLIWPESASTAGSEYTLTLTHDMNLVSSSFPVYKINAPDNLSEYLVLQYYSGSGIPTASGQYSFTLDEAIQVATGSYTWGSASLFWKDARFTWEGNISTGSAPIGSGRAFVEGTNDPLFTKYQSSNEEGEYITYYTG